MRWAAAMSGRLEITTARWPSARDRSTHVPGQGLADALPLRGRAHGEHPELPLVVAPQLAAVGARRRVGDAAEQGAVVGDRHPEVGVRGPGGRVAEPGRRRGRPGPSRNGVVRRDGELADLGVLLGPRAAGSASDAERGPGVGRRDVGDHVDEVRDAGGERAVEGRSDLARVGDGLAGAAERRAPPRRTTWSGSRSATTS